MMLALLTGAGTGLGLALLAYGLRPPRPALADLLHTLRHAPPPAPGRRDRVYALTAAPARRLGLPRDQVRRDLTTTGKDPAQHLTEQTTTVLAGALILPLCAALLGLRGQIPLWLAALGAAVAFRWTDARLHHHAQTRRAELRHTLAVLLTLLTISLARGAGIDQALTESTSICTGRAADQLRHALTTARIFRQPPWEALDQLGEDTAVAELTELAAAMALAGTEGAKIRAALSARATAMRQAATTQRETETEKATSRMSLPLLLLGIGYLIFLLYPPLVTITASL